MNRMWIAAIVMVFCAAAVAAPLALQTPPTRERTAEGARLFIANCASCHGTSGQGNGPLTGLLRNKPADLTQIAIMNGGMFPTARVHRIIDGRDVGSHGAPEMPVWGEAFRTAPGGFSEESVRQRIAALVEYLESIQRRLAH